MTLCINNLPDELLRLIMEFLGNQVCITHMYRLPKCLQRFTSSCQPIDHEHIFHSGNKYTICLLEYKQDLSLLHLIKQVLSDIDTQLLYNRTVMICIHFDQKIKNNYKPIIVKLINNLDFSFSHFCCDGQGFMTHHLKSKHSLLY